MRRLPLAFEPNQGQAAANVRFLAAAPGTVSYLGGKNSDQGLAVAVDAAGEAVVGCPLCITLQGPGIGVPQSIAFGAISTQKYGVPVDLNATTSSALPVAYAVPGPATLAGNVVSPTGVGSITVTASQTGNATYSGAPLAPCSWPHSPCS